MNTIGTTTQESFISRQQIKRLTSEFVVQLKQKKIGLTLIVIGSFLISAPIPIYIKKIGLTLLIISIFWTIFIEEENILSFKKRPKNKAIKYLNITFIAIVAWVLIAYLLTSITDFELFFVTTFVGILIIKQFANEYLTALIKRRYNYIIIGFFIVFFAIAINKILGS